MRMTVTLLTAALAAFLLRDQAFAAPSSSSALDQRPRLLLVVVVDQLRADAPHRFAGRLLPGGKKAHPAGFRWLAEHGAWFAAADHDVTQPMTAPGHATLLTGAWPSGTGIVLNAWYDRRTGTRLGAVDDSSAPLCGDPTPTATGASPHRLRGGTVGDELKNAGLNSKVVAVALKARAAVLLGGHRADAAIWFDESSFRWVTSRFYAPDCRLPAWVSASNDALGRLIGTTWRWQAGSVRSGRAHASPTADFGGTWTVGDPRLLATPWGIERTIDLAVAVLRAEGLGQDDDPDLLAVSLSSHDMVGHARGPNSLEAEEIFVAADRALARLLGEIQRHVPGGLDRVVVAVTGDHGVMPEVGYLQAHRIPARHLDNRELCRIGEAALVQRFGPPAKGLNWLVSCEDLHLWLSPRALEARPKEAPQVREVLREALRSLPGVAQVVTLDDWRSGRLPPGDLGQRLARQWHPDRSGDVLVVPEPWVTEAGDFATHLTPYSYDRLVPLFLAGQRSLPGVQARTVLAVDLAPTLAFLAGVLPPPLNEGRVLEECLERPPARGAEASTDGSRFNTLTRMMIRWRAPSWVTGSRYL